jgi:hypothetical protein
MLARDTRIEVPAANTVHCPSPELGGCGGVGELSMAESDSEKRGQACEMNQRQTADAIPIPSAPVLGIVEADLQAHIGRQLRAVYDEVVNEAVPDRFLELLRELERKNTEQA